MLRLTLTPQVPAQPRRRWPVSNPRSSTAVARGPAYLELREPGAQQLVDCLLASGTLPRKVHVALPRRDPTNQDSGRGGHRDHLLQQALHAGPPPGAPVGRFLDHKNTRLVEVDQTTDLGDGGLRGPPSALSGPPIDE
jgi:hypothetical protein